MFFKHIFVALAFTFLTGLGWAQTQKITILSYNIYHGENPYHPGDANLEDIAKLIKSLNPDVVAMQEVDSMTTRTERVYGQKTDLVKELGKITGMSSYFAKAMDFAEGGYGEGILAKGSPKFSTQNLPVPVGGEPRAAAWAETADGFLVGGTHLCHQYAANRTAQVQELLEFATTQDLPVIWMGDLNFGPTSNEYTLIGNQFTDAAKAANNDQPTYRSESFADRIDYVWYSSKHFKLVSYEVLDVPHSDHFPVLVTLEKL